MERIDLERARRDAKALLRAARAGEAELRTDRAPALADAQRAVAVELGYASWPALVAGVRGSALLAAAEAGRASEVYRLLVEGAPANARDGAGRTALHLAAAGAFADVVDVLVGWVPVDREAVDDTGRVASSDDPVVARMLALREPPGEDSALGELAWRADADLFSLIAGSPLASRRAVGDGFAFRTGLLDNTRNGVVCSRTEDVEDAIAWLGGAPAQWLIGANSALGPSLERAGCRPERAAVFMAREAAAPRDAAAAPRDDAAAPRDDAAAPGAAAAPRDAAAAPRDAAARRADAARRDAAARRDDVAAHDIVAIRDAATLRAAMAAVD